MSRMGWAQRNRSTAAPRGAACDGFRWVYHWAGQRLDPGAQPILRHSPAPTRSGHVS